MQDETSQICAMLQNILQTYAQDINLHFKTPVSDLRIFARHKYFGYTLF